MSFINGQPTVMSSLTPPSDPLIGKRVEIRRLNAEDPVVLERTICFVGLVGEVQGGPDPSGGYWVGFETPCAAHGDTGAVYYTPEFTVL